MAKFKSVLQQLIDTDRPYRLATTTTKHNILKIQVCSKIDDSLTVRQLALFANESLSHLYDIFSKNLKLKAAYSVTMNIFRKKYFLFKSFAKVELSNVFTIKMFSISENCMEK